MLYRAPRLFLFVLVLFVLFSFFQSKDLLGTCDLVIRSFALLHWMEEILDPVCSEGPFVCGTLLLVSEDFSYI